MSPPGFTPKERENLKINKLTAKTPVRMHVDCRCSASTEKSLVKKRTSAHSRLPLGGCEFVWELFL